MSGVCSLTLVIAPRGKTGAKGIDSCSNWTIKEMGNVAWVGKSQSNSSKEEGSPMIGIVVPKVIMWTPRNGGMLLCSNSFSPWRVVQERPFQAKLT